MYVLLERCEAFELPTSRHVTQCSQVSGHEHRRQSWKLDDWISYLVSRFRRECVPHTAYTQEQLNNCATVGLTVPLRCDIISLLDLQYLLRKVKYSKHEIFIWGIQTVSLLPPGYRLINSVSLWVVEVYQICTAYFSQVMHFIVTWLCAVRRGKGNWPPYPHSTPGLVRLAVVVWGVLYVYIWVCACVCMVCGYAHLVPVLYGDPTSLRADNCT
jgi:hypothetical protein